MIGQVMGGYTIAEMMSAGAGGDVYLAEHRRIHRRAAVKLLRPLGGPGGDGAVEGFFGEARKLASLGHPGVVEIYDADLHAGRIYLLMELLEGASLAAVLARAGSFASETTTAAALGLQIADTLAAAHGFGIAHGALAADNVFLDVPPEGDRPVRAKLLNFGLARLRRGIGGGAPAPADDVRAFGRLLFHMLTGSAATASGPERRVPSSMQPGISRELDDLVADLLAEAPDGQMVSMESVAARLWQAMGERRPLSSKKIRASGAPCVVAPVVEPAPQPPRAPIVAPAVEPAPQAPQLPTVAPVVAPAPPARQAPKTLRDLVPPDVPEADAPATTGALLPPPPLAATGPRASAGGTRIIPPGAPLVFPPPPLPRPPRRPIVPIPRTQVVVRPRRGRPWLWVGLASAAAIVLIVSIALVGSTGARPATRHPVEPEEAEGTATAPVFTPHEPPAPAPPPAPTPTVTIELISHPEGAEALVVGESTPRGKTPLKLEIPRSQKAVELRLSAGGYVDRTVALDVVTDHAVEVNLEKAPDHRVAPPAAHKTHDQHPSAPKYYLLGD
jgi:serine/threonine-protein kinase